MVRRRPLPPALSRIPSKFTLQRMWRAAQSPAGMLCLLTLLDGVPAGAANPVIHYRYLADPSLRQFSDGRFYLFGTNEVTNEDPHRRDWGTVDHRIQSSDDLVNWRDHGVAISRRDLTPLEGRFPGISRKPFWAPDGAENPKGRFHIFLSLGAYVAVASSDSPTGPFRDPAVLHVVADSKNREIGGPLDPCVFKDLTGQWYVAYQYDTEKDNAYKRTTCIDYLYFNPDSTIRKVVLTREGVQPVRSPRKQ